MKLRGCGTKNSLSYLQKFTWLDKVIAVEEKVSFLVLMLASDSTPLTYVGAKLFRMLEYTI